MHASGAFSVLRQRFFLTVALRKLPEAFGLTFANSWYPHYLYSRTNLDYVGNIPEITYYVIDVMSDSGRNEFRAWYECQNDEVFDNRRVLEAYSQDDLSLFWEACRMLRREFIQIGNIDVFLESVTIPLACNKLMRKRFLKPNAKGGYTAT